MFKIEVQKQYIVICENWDGRCKRFKVWAWTNSEALGKATRNGWVAVGVE